MVSDCRCQASLLWLLLWSSGCGYGSLYDDTAHRWSEINHRQPVPGPPLELQYSHPPGFYSAAFPLELHVSLAEAEVYWEQILRNG